jgi:hypothetical protein
MHRQAERGLARVVRHRVAHDADAELGGDLLHDGGLADARGAQQEDGALAAGLISYIPASSFLQIRVHRVLIWSFASAMFISWSFPFYFTRGCP